VCVWQTPPGVLEGMPEGAWPPRERDVAAASRGHCARQGRGGVVARHGAHARSRVLAS
jgi:hypothetical protein